MDEKGKELVRDKQPAQPAKPGRPNRYDYEYERLGSCNLFVAYNIQTRQRHAQVTEQRRGSDWAQFLAYLAGQVYPQASKLVIVCDNLNIHSAAPLYEVYPASQAREVAARLEFHYTPKHASWLNMVEIELSALERQCLDRRLASAAAVATEVAAFCQQRNKQGSRIKWQFNCEQARTKLDFAYPVPLLAENLSQLNSQLG